jgi:hypothetical protein
VVGMPDRAGGDIYPWKFFFVTGCELG